MSFSFDPTQRDASQATSNLVAHLRRQFPGSSEAVHNAMNYFRRENDTARVLVGDESRSYMAVHHARAGMRTAADARLVDGKIVGEVSLQYGWMRTVYARGVCQQVTVLEIIDESPDHTGLTVNAARWRDDDRGPVLRDQLAELTETEPGTWNLRWLD